MKLTGKTALVTGGTDGIGREIARQLRAKGAGVIVHGRNPERIAAAQADGFETIAADLSTPAGIEALVAAIQGRTLDILVNNAGMGAAYDVNAAIDLDVLHVRRHRRHGGDECRQGDIRERDAESRANQREHDALGQ